MEAMSSFVAEPVDLLDLKLLPAWLKEPAESNRYEDYTGEQQRQARRNHADAKGKRLTGRTTGKEIIKMVGRDRRARRLRHRRGAQPERGPLPAVTGQPEIVIRVLPAQPAL